MTHSTLTLTRPDDWHVHLRDSDVLSHVLAHTATQFARAVVMPNLKPPVTTTALATGLPQAHCAGCASGRGV
jgi:dihydroorotase